MLQVYGAVAMNNTMCLGLFLLVIWYRGLDWDFSSEARTALPLYIYIYNIVFYYIIIIYSYALGGRPRLGLSSDRPCGVLDAA